MPRGSCRKNSFAARLVSTLGLAFAGLGHAAAPDAGSPFQGDGEIVLWIHADREGEKNAYKESIAAFNKTSRSLPARIAALPPGSFTDQVEAAAEAKALPCIMDFDGPNLYRYASGGTLLALDGFESLKPVIDDMIPPLKRQGTYQGALYGIGQYDSGLAIWGNRKLLAKVGARIPNGPSDAWDLGEFVDILQRLKKSGVPYPLDMKLNYGAGEWFTYGFSPLLQSFGGDLVRRTDPPVARGTLDSPASIAALKTLQEWIRRGYVNPKQGTDDDFVSGRAALSYVGHWVYPGYGQALGADLLLLPMPKFGPRQVTGSGSWNFGISKTCPYPKQAAEVLRFLMSKDEVLRMAQASGAVPGTASALAASKAYGPDGPLQLYATQLQSNLAIPRPSTPFYSVITAEFSDALKAVIDGESPDFALGRAAYLIDEQVAKQPPSAK